MTALREKIESEIKKHPDNPSDAYYSIIERFSNPPEYDEDILWSCGTLLLSPSEKTVNVIADIFEERYPQLCMVTGYYEPEEDERMGEVDECTGFYYVDIG